MEAHCDLLPSHLAPLDEMDIDGWVIHPVSMCGAAPDDASIAAYGPFAELVKQTGSTLNACDHACQLRQNGNLLVRPSFLTLYHETIRPLSTQDINALWLIGRNNMLTISLFMFFHQEGYFKTPLLS